MSVRAPRPRKVGSELVPPPRVICMAVAVLALAGDLDEVTVEFGALCAAADLAPRTLLLAMQEAVELGALSRARRRGPLVLSIVRRHHLWALAGVVSQAMAARVSEVQV